MYSKLILDQTKRFYKTIFKQFYKTKYSYEKVIFVNITSLE